MAKTKTASHQCVDHLKDTKIKVEEMGRSAILLNDDRTPVRRIKVDNCLIKEGIKCDWAISHPTKADVLIELKGTDVDHAIMQLERTLGIWSTHELRKDNSKLSALIVCSQYPKFNKSVARAQTRFAERFRAPLRVSSRNLSYSFDELARFG